MTQELEELAGKLTPGERSAVLRTVPGETYPYSEVHGIPRIALFRKGVFGSTPYHDRYRFQLSDLGAALRNHLLSKGSQA